MDHTKTPLFDTLLAHKKEDPVSFHVPGHKNGTIFSKRGMELYQGLLSIDATELTGLDDLHAPTGVIKEAQHLAADWFQADYSHFLVGGSTVGNLAMILATCSTGDKILVQRNCHKSVLHGLELAGAKPVFLAPEFDERVNRYTAPSFKLIKEAITKHPDSKALFVTYPDYFGMTYNLEKIITYTHERDIPVLIDEAHGVHFSLGKGFPDSALNAGADAVVQSAHKMAPAMTMASYLHVQSKYVSNQRITYYLNMVQSSSPSYPVMASLDLARHYLAGLTESDLDCVATSVNHFCSLIEGLDIGKVLRSEDPLKITVDVSESGLSSKQIAALFEENHIYPELTTDTQILFIHGLAPIKDWDQLTTRIDRIKSQLNNLVRHDTIEVIRVPQVDVQALDISYEDMKTLEIKQVNLLDSIERISAENIVPYPPGIPLVFKGERISQAHVDMIQYLLDKGISFQNIEINEKVHVFSDIKGE
ncbi:aminotransferase class I/II-fold pyridoxal phosphate-dependent enzyme (plasmid) [Radiobacillus kanasensis]|uniref:aminotransferase class I/II-fold pyridoxal phosphate-dependent enzyme n=1 Tax=Radiobacillus kanasensis TaxID=2844358 RepID=UPI001E513EF4|nr:aminotransferase class I/II-fold pyridoxal phosphate-dependent enzyme [Radiobacillus kanasensis]UFU01499.1 aminotransferase class I/II-fold pyridoxal phosphate-dependent enzyme [Radiobacillus kanasensis]